MDGHRVKPRRTHRKSRGGCHYCKGRRIKCDEAKPSCGNCTRRSIHCSFSPDEPNVINTSLTGAISRGLRSISLASEQRLNATSRESPASQPSASDATLSADDARSDDADLPIWDLELLHHYMTATSHRFGSSADNLHFWQREVPELSFKYHFLLRLLLALTAYHRAITDSKGRDQLTRRANELFDAGVKAETELVTRIDSDNSMALYLGAVLICFCTFAAGPKPTDYLIFSDTGGPAALSMMVRGVRAIVDHSQDSPEKRTLQSAARMAKRHEECMKEVRYQNKESPHHAAFQKLRGYFVQPTLPHRQIEAAVYAEEINKLEQAFSIILHDVPQNAEIGVRYAHVMFAWIYRTTDEYNALVQRKQPPALIIFGYFAALMKYHDALWILKGWPEHLIGGVYANIPEVDRKWIEWPMEQIGWTPP